MILSAGSLYTSTVTGYVYEIVALTPKVLYSPIKTYTTDVANTRIFQRTVEDFTSRYIEGDVAFNALLSRIDNQPLTSRIDGSVLIARVS